MRLLGIDYGQRRIGFAVSDPMGIIATPLESVTVCSPQEAADATVRIAEEQEATSLVVGLPLNMDGSSGAAVDAVEKFCELVSSKVELPIHKYDERLTTAIAERVLIEADISRAKRKGVVDKLAAQIILQSYLDANG